MPTVFRNSGDGVEPPHVHVERDDKIAKFWLRPVRLQEGDGVNRVEIGRLQGVVEENLETLLRSWEAYFGN